MIARRFELGDAVAAGGGGTVYRARDRANGADVAVKVLDAKREADLERFHREADVLSRIQHPGVVRYLDHGVVEGKAYIAMDWVEGVSLQRALHQTRMQPEQIFDLLVPLADALAVVHDDGIVHRDLKPTNVMLADSDFRRPVLIDFGVAHFHAAPSLTCTGAYIGTPGFMAPELARGERNVDARADVFALGCLLYRCLTGEPPFDGNDLFEVLSATCLQDPLPVSQRVPDLPSGLAALLDRMLAKDRVARPANAQAVASALRRIGRREESEGRSPARAPGIGYRAQRFACVVAVREMSDDEHASSSAQGPPSIRATVVGNDNDEAAYVGNLAQYYGGTTTPHADRTSLVTFTASGHPSELALRAAAFARSLIDRNRSFAAYIASGRVIVDGSTVSGDPDRRAISGIDETPSGTILAEPEVARLLADHMTSTRADGGFFKIKADAGKGAEIDASAAPWFAPPFVGRDREMAFLTSLLIECESQSEARAVRVLGAPGSGKSRLRLVFTEIVRRVHPHARILFGRASPCPQPSLALLGSMSDLPRPDRSPIGADWARVPRGEGPSAWLEWLGAELGIHPVVIVLEDVQWADRASLECMGEAIAALACRPLFVVAFGRPEAAFSSMSRKGAPWQEIHLTRLARRAAARIVNALASLPPPKVETILDLGAGNPAWLEEIVRAVRDGRESPLTPVLLGMLLRAFDALSVDAARVLRAASLFEPAFQAKDVAAILGLPDATADVHRWIAELEAHRLVQAAGDAYAFRSALVREAAYATLTEEDRRLAHRIATGLPGHDSAGSDGGRG